MQWDKAGLPLALAIMCALFSYLNRSFLSVNNFMNIARQCSVLAILSVGQTLVMITGGINLSIGSLVAFSSVFGATQMLNYGLWGGIAAGLLIGALCGLIAGVIIARTGLPPFIVTLGLMTFLRGAAFTYTGGMPVVGLPSGFMYLGAGSLLGVPVPGIIAIGVLALFHFILTRTRLGRFIYAIGGNEEAATLSGVPVTRCKVVAYTLSGLLAALGGLILTSRVVSGQPSIGETLSMEAVAASVIGGTSLRGGEGTMIGTFLGVLVVSLLGNGLNLIRVSSFAQMMVIGVITVGAAYLDVFYKKRMGS